MTEREIRELLRTVCLDLDRCARKVVRKVLVPSMLGAGLALAGCSDRDPTPTDDSSVASEMGPVYGAPDATLDGGPMPPYMAPDDSGIGPQPLYAAPGPDGGGPQPQPDYMAPDP
jgi:hypothetical protein